MRGGDGVTPCWEVTGLVPTHAACHQILMLLLTYLWNASPSVCKETSKIYLHNYCHDAPALLCAGNLQHRGPEPWCAPGRMALNPAHPSRLQSARPGAGAQMNHTRSLPTESSQSTGRGNTHIDHSSPAWPGTSAQIQGDRQAGLKRGKVFSLSESGSRAKPKARLHGATQLLQPS